MFFFFQTKGWSKEKEILLFNDFEESYCIIISASNIVGDTFIPSFCHSSQPSKTGDDLLPHQTAGGVVEYGTDLNLDVATALKSLLATTKKNLKFISQHKEFEIYIATQKECEIYIATKKEFEIYIATKKEFEIYIATKKEYEIFLPTKKFGCSVVDPITL